jgi:hypothetical protein
MPIHAKGPSGIYDVERKGFEPPRPSTHIHAPKEVHIRGAVRLMCDCGSWHGDKPLPSAT